MPRRIISASRYLIAIAAAAILLLATALLLYGAAQTYVLLAGIAAGSLAKSKALVLAAIELVDLLLLATVLYVIAIGLYELFIDDQLPLPEWLEIHSLDDLKDKLIGVVVLVMAVLFLGQLIGWDGQRDLLSFGAATALVIAALTYFASQKKAKKNNALKDQ